LRIEFKPDQINRLLGVKLSKAYMQGLLKKLGFVFTDAQVSVPSFRQRDVQRTADLAEEIGRFYGFDRNEYLMKEAGRIEDNGEWGAILHRERDEILIGWLKERKILFEGNSPAPF